jgi:hypothetical protein
LERDIDGLDIFMNGKSLSKHIEALDAAAGELGVSPLSEFYSIDPAQAADFAGMDLEDVNLPELEHFSAKDGLTTVRALLAHKPVHQDHVLQDLQDCERILSVAAKHSVGWHFEVDV